MKKRTDKVTVLIVIIAIIAAFLAVVLRVLPALSGGNERRLISDKLKSGQKYLAEMDYDQAIAAFNEALEIDDRNTEAYVGLGDAYTGKEDWTPAVTNYDEAIETVAEQAPVDAVSAEEIAEVIEDHVEITFAGEDEWTLIAALENNDELEIPGILVETIDADYVEEIIIKRNHALYEGVQVFLLPGAESNDYHAWLDVVMHPEYDPGDQLPQDPEMTDDTTAAEAVEEYVDPADGSTAATAAAATEVDDTEKTTETLLPDIPSDFVFSSGAGGWATEITLNRDGTFSAHFKDTEYGAGEIYYCDFTGRFTGITQVNEYTYSMELTELNVETEKDSTFEQDGYTWIGADPYGFNDGGKEYILYLPDTPVAELNETFLSWVNPIHTVTGDRLGCIAIYDASGEKQFGFVEWSY